MAQPPTFFDGAHHFRMDHTTIYAIAGNQYQILNVQQDLHHRLNPILDASHTRNRSTSPPDSECFPGTRGKVIKKITAWGDAAVESTLCWETGDKGLYWETGDKAKGLYRTSESDHSGNAETSLVLCTTPHVYWLHGFAGCGKSAVSLNVAKIYSGSGRLLASYFFFRGAGDRSTMRRFAVTLASQLAAALPATVPLIEAAVKAEPGLLTNQVSLATQLDRLILFPFRSLLDQGVLAETLADGPFLIVIDGLDECEDKRGVEEFINHILNFFKGHPIIPLRVFIASRVEQHIRNHLETDGVVLGNLDSHSAKSDIKKFLEVSFATVAKKDRVVKAYVRTHGSWPTKSDKLKLVKHINGSFVLASTMFKYIVQPPTKENPKTPMERLPLTLEMNGLDGLYSQTLAHSQHLPHFHNIISAIVLILKPFSIVEISAILGIEAFEVVGVLLNLQAIIHVPGTDEKGEVTLCHKSLRDFLTTESRSGPFFVSASFHLYLSYYWFQYRIGDKDVGDRNVGASSFSSRTAFDLSIVYFDHHRRYFAESGNCDFLTEIERFKARQPLLVDGVSHHLFLCTTFFYTFLLQTKLRVVNGGDSCYMVTQCANQLALVAECADPHIRRWLETGWNFDQPHRLRNKTQPHRLSMTQLFTEHTYEALQHALRCASNTIQAHFPGFLESRPSSTGKEKGFRIGGIPLSGTVIFNALEWMVARAHFKWEELKVTPRPPLELSVGPSYAWSLTLTFEKGVEWHDSDEDPSYWNAAAGR